jgi:hypothetical protein
MSRRATSMDCQEDTSARKRVASKTNLLKWHAVASGADDVENVLTDINSVDSRRAQHIALWHSSLLRFDRLDILQEDEEEYPIDGRACRQA